MRSRVVVTGLGAVSPLGNDVPTMWEGLLAGRSGVGPITLFDTAGLDIHIAAEVKDFDPQALFDRRTVRRNGRFALFAMEAARQAVVDARLQFEDGDCRRIGVLIGTALGGIVPLIEGCDIFRDHGPRRVVPLMSLMIMPNAASAAIAMEYGLRGPNFSVSSACATGTHSIGEGAEIIRRGDAEVMICGGSEAAIVPIGMVSLNNMGAISCRNDEPLRASRPFDAQRDGFVAGEGAGVLVLESLEHAQRRGARIYCELAGYGATADAFHITAPDESGQGAAWAMEAALEDARLQPEDVDYINAHGTGTRLNDAAETEAIKMVFGQRAYQIPISSNKSMVGHLACAAGSVEAVAAVMTIREGIIPPTINYETPDPDCDLDYVPNQARRQQVNTCLSNSFGMGGQNCSLVLRRFS